MANLLQNSLLKPYLLKRFHARREGASFVPLKEAGSIGIVADMVNPEHPPAIIKFSKEL